MGTWEQVYRRSLDDPEGFWAAHAEHIDWIRRPDQVLDDSNPPFYRWFAGGTLNTAANCLDRHVEGGRADQPALIHDSAYTGQHRTYSYRQLRDEVALFAGALRDQGVEKGDRVIIYMPMVPEAAIAMLACARLGAVHSVVFGGFAARELAGRIDHARPKVVVSASCGIEPTRIVEYAPLVREAVRVSSGDPRIVMLQREQHPVELSDGEIDWSQAVAAASPADPVAVAATDPLYILYTSGTTGQPKGIVRDNGGHAVALKWSMGAVYGVDPGQVYWAASDVGWVVGHSYIVYAPLLHGCTTVMYEGKPVGTPDAGAFWRVIADHGVSVLFTAPTAFRAIKRADAAGDHIARYDLSALRTLFLAGERCDPDTLLWAQDRLGVPVVDHWWQTETGWPMAANPLGIEQFPVKPGSATKPVPGWDVRVMDADGERPAGEIGDIVVRLPLPPGSLPTLWDADDRYVSEYLSRYDGFYLTGDAGKFDDDGYLSIMSRTDDIINVAGHRLSTGAIEEVLAAHPDVAEAAVFGVPDELKGEVPLGLVTLSSGVQRDPGAIADELVQRVRDEIGPVASFKRAIVVQALPKTRSGKILRRTMRSIAQGEDPPIPSTIEDASVLPDLAEAIRSPQR